MAVRALIIAIESYPQVTVGGMAKSLPGTLQSGLDFKAWLLKKWQDENQQDTQVIFCSEPVQPGAWGASHVDILKALRTLRDEGRGTTEELFFFFSGHGCTLVEGLGERADIIIASNFVDADLSSSCCLPLDGLIAWLRYHMGFGRHYYFVDACRNRLGRNQIGVGSLPTIDQQTSGEPSTFMLQSTVPGATADAGVLFTSALLDGLRGKGTAKVWDNRVADAMLVRFDSVRTQVRTTLAGRQSITSTTAGTEGETDAVLATLRPIPIAKCTVEISNASLLDKGTLWFKRGRSGTSEKRAITGPSTILEFEPDDYTITLGLDGATVEPSKPIVTNFYEDRHFNFKKVAGLPLGAEVVAARAPPVVTTKVDVVVPQTTKLELHNLTTDAVTPVSASARVSMPRGRYLATFRDHDDRVLKRREIELSPGAEVSLRLDDWETSLPHRAIATHLPTMSDGRVDFSESLGGPVADPDLDVWLALIGAGRIFGPRYQKLARLPLHQFGQERPGASPIYVLAGLEEASTKLAVGTSWDANVRWTPATSPESMHGVCEATIDAQPGAQLLSFRLGDQPPYTVATFASPNRTMLVTFSLGEDGAPHVAQYLLPLGHLMNQFPPEVANLIFPFGQLRDVLYLAQGQRAFRNRRDVAKQIPENELRNFLYLKWLEPISCLLAGYEYVRRGKSSQLGEAVNNLIRYFPSVPDTASLARLCGRTDVLESGTPLFLDGLRAFPSALDRLPLPAGHLDFNSPWTAWRAAAKV